MLLGQNTHAFLFDGVSDSIIIPYSGFHREGVPDKDGSSSSGTINTNSPSSRKSALSPPANLGIDAFVIPDCGGIIASQEGRFKLEMGSVDTPGPAIFTVFGKTNSGPVAYTITTAQLNSDETRYVGHTYPEHTDTVFNSYNRFISSSDDATSLNINSRPLYHIHASAQMGSLSLSINGRLVEKLPISTEFRFEDTTEPIYLGGKGGEYRGSIESISFSHDGDHKAYPEPMTLRNQHFGLYRFEEPTDVSSEIYEVASFSAHSDGSTKTMTLSGSDALTKAQALIERVTGKEYDSSNPTITLTDSPYSMGSYDVASHSGGSFSTDYIPHTPLNILMNPGALHLGTKKPNQKPPERLRVTSINGSSGVIGVESIHIDYDNGTRRGALHDRTNGDDAYFVLIFSDILIDGGTGAPVQATHRGSQFIDRVGQVLIDESAHGNHGMFYSSRMATQTLDTDNPFAINWPSALSDTFQIGHSGRHGLNNVQGHDFLRQLPPGRDERFERSTDVLVSNIEVDYDAAFQNVSSHIPVNSEVSLFKTTTPVNIHGVHNTGMAFTLVENGMAGLDNTQRAPIAIGGSGTKTNSSDTELDFRPFLLRAPIVEAGDVSTGDSIYNKHLTPVSESRIAILKVPTLATHDLAPYVHLHYNAVDLTGESIKYQASTRASGYSGTTLTVNSTKGFAATGTLTDNSGTSTSYTVASDTTLTVSSGLSFASGDIVRSDLTGPLLLIEKMEPDPTYVVSGTTTVLDVIHSDLADAAKDTFIIAPGGVLTISLEDKGLGPLLDDHSTIGDDREGRDVEDILDDSLSPLNYVPSESGDAPQSPPQHIVEYFTSNSSPSSVFHRGVIASETNENVTTLSVGDLDTSIELSPLKSETGTGVFDIPSTTQAAGMFESFDIIDNMVSDGRYKLLVQPTQRYRTAILSGIRGKFTDADNHQLIIHYLLSRGRVLSVEEQISETALTARVIARGLEGDLVSRSDTDIVGKGSPDSNIVKEIMPGAPVVAMTLGGPGQGATNTKPTWDPSPFARLGGNLRRDSSSLTTSTTSTTLVTQPLNNTSSDLASWGTYGFPKKGRIYLDSGASAYYESKTGTTFTFSNTGALTDGKFLLADGGISATFAAWVSAESVVAGTVIHVDGEFGDESICPDGTTVNDRLFQQGSSVTHDYQLGTQYASTRALVEIPIFPDQVFGDPSKSLFVGPDNSMKLHLDATYTAHTWNPNPVGRRPDSVAPNDRVADSAFTLSRELGVEHIGTTITRPFEDTGANYELYVQDASIFPDQDASATTINSINGSVRFHRAVLPSGEWMIYTGVDTTNNKLTLDDADTWGFSDNFLSEAITGVQVQIVPGSPSTQIERISDGEWNSTGAEFRSSYHYDRANVQTQGGNVDYGLGQYVSAVEFRAGPRTNPHLPRISSKRARGKVLSFSGSTLILEDASEFPTGEACNIHSGYEFEISYIDKTNGKQTATYTVLSGNEITVINKSGSFNPPDGAEIIVERFFDYGGAIYPLERDDVALNRKWLNPYAPGGLRHGDTIWMNMHFTNPHAVEGLFCKSRGVLDESKVSKHFNGGMGDFATRPRDSIPIENFLIGDTCIETAANFIQHVNKTIELNWAEIGRSGTAPIIAFSDPYQFTEEHARILLYDVEGDKEFIAFQDMWMQVQTSAEVPHIGTRTPAATDGNVADDSDRLDVPAGFPSEDKHLSSSAKSHFIESAYAHSAAGNMLLNKHHGQDIAIDGSISTASSRRTAEESVDSATAWEKHRQGILTTDTEFRDGNTFFDTPDGTRVIPAFLCLKGIRATAVDLSGHRDTRLQHLPQWKDMEFTRRMTVDLGEIALREGVTDIEAAAKEIIRQINQGGAKQGRTHLRRPADSYPGETDRLDLTRVGVRTDSMDSNKDPTAVHNAADFAPMASTHDPAPWWSGDQSMVSDGRGTHMGYLRAHIGRVVEDSDGNEGFTIVVHSTVPGASGRHFAVWMDNARGQAPYRPQFLVGHGGRFRNFWCFPDERTTENMHPAPMPINRHGRPFAPITTLKEFIADEANESSLRNNAEYSSTQTTASQSLSTGAYQNTLYEESYESAGGVNKVVDGLRVGTTATARINFGGLTSSGVPGFSPFAGKWGFGKGMKTEMQNVYSPQQAIVETEYSSHVPTADVDEETFGRNNLYGVRFVDHRGESHTIRFVYRRYGDKIAEDSTVLPSTLDEEIVVYFDDRDVAQGGFTIGRHMWGEGDVSGRLNANTPIGAATTYTTIASKKWVGNTWATYPSPDVGVAVTVVHNTSDKTLTFVLQTPFDTGSTLSSHPDMLGYLGLPDSGLVQINKQDLGGGAPDGEQGSVFSYTHRTHNDRAGAHVLYGVEAVSSASDFTDAGTPTPGIFNPRINWTCLLTDEILAKVVEFAINMENPSASSVQATSFDCSLMYAADGKTFGEWGVAKDAIRIIGPNRKTSTPPLSALFVAETVPDYGIQAKTREDEFSADGSFASYTVAQYAENIQDDIRSVGYLPETVLVIRTKYRGTNANTATPTLVDSENNTVDTTVWRDALRGTKYVSTPGDLILPKIDNPSLRLLERDAANIYNLYTSGGSVTFFMYHALIPVSGGESSGTPLFDAWSERRTMYLGSENTATVFSQYIASHTVTNEEEAVIHITNDSGSFDSTANTLIAASRDPVIQRFGDPTRSKLFDGVRVNGSLDEPIIKFRGAQDSPDHWVPLFFGGGFSGAAFDINDGSQADYTDTNDHPYHAGPLGSSGLQNIGELHTAYSVLDAAAMLAFFPGTPYLNQHKGAIHPPLHNQDNLLSYDLDAGQNSAGGRTGVTYTVDSMTVNCTIPSPLILRFPHAHARYNSTGDGDARTTYLIFGPGQSFPTNLKATEPSLDDIIVSGNGYSKVVTGAWLPNEIANGDKKSLSGTASILPRTKQYQIGNVSGYNYVMNWEPAEGMPNYISQTTNGFGYSMTARTGVKFGNHFQDPDPSRRPPPYAHPFEHIPSGVKESFTGWHMDGGMPPGGHFLDNHIVINPINQSTSAALGVGSGAKKHPASFRVAGLLATSYLTAGDAIADDHVDHDYIVVDGTRAQNGEELAAVLATAINTFPGTSPLKAIGGTFLPSFQSAHQQDRVGWVEVDFDSSPGYDETAGTVDATSTLPTTLPTRGFIRLNKGGNDDGSAVHTTTYARNTETGVYGYYVSYSGARFTLDDNYRNSHHKLEDPLYETNDANSRAVEAKVNANATKIYISTQSGTKTFDNGGRSGNEHMTRLHFSGLHNAIDRTAPVGAVGWHGEMYSYLNSMSVTNPDGSTAGHPAGLGAWHSMLGFSPYGSTTSCFNKSVPVSGDYGDVAITDQKSVGLSGRHWVVVKYETELPLIAKKDKYSLATMGDFLSNAGPTKWNDEVHNVERYVCTANAGPNVEAQIMKSQLVPTNSASYPAVGTETHWHPQLTAHSQLGNATPCLNPTGDLFFDANENPANTYHETSSLVINRSAPTEYEGADEPFNFHIDRTTAVNFSVEHIVWKRMDGGNITLPAPNARGLGMLPKPVRVKSSTAHTMGETIYGNVRFSIETTNSCMYPIIQAQELAHPQLAEEFPLELRNVLEIPNEEIQFERIEVVDDTGQVHELPGGSPLGVVIRDFAPVEDRDISGPALRGSGNSPNMNIQLPDPADIPGNVIVRSGHDRIQALQTETMGAGGMLHPDQPTTPVADVFKSTNPGPRLWPNYENNGWEHISLDETNDETKSVSRLAFPDQHSQGWYDTTEDKPLKTSYEPHDRTLYFHLTKMQAGHTHRESVAYSNSTVETQTLGYTSISGTVITADATINTAIFQDTSEKTGNRWIARVYDTSTNEGALFSYTGINGATFTGVVLSSTFTSFVTGKTGLKITPSYYVPAGSTRIYAAKRLRDHAEVSGNSPDMRTIDWTDIGASAATYNAIKAPTMTPMPVPRMGHHFVSPTMLMMPGHFAHPAYQGAYDNNRACEGVRVRPLEETTGTFTDVVPARDPLIWFSSQTTPFAPSDIHGSAHTLLVESAVKYDGYGIAASVGAAGTVNANGDHRIILEASGAHTLRQHFPDPMEVGAYQIIIQPNITKKQLVGFHRNAVTATQAPVEGGSLTSELTSMQVATVIAIAHDTGSSYGSNTLILAEATMADVRGCEIIMNELMLDLDPDVGSQFASLPPLALSNPFGINETSPPPFTRRSLPYRNNMFVRSTPGYTFSIPWWSHRHRTIPDGTIVVELTGNPTASQTLVLVSDAGTTKTYTGVAGSPTLSSNQFSIDDDPDDVAASLKLAIEHSSGHNGEILVERLDSILTLRQSTGKMASASFTNNLSNCTVSSAAGFINLEHHKPDDYYLFCRSTLGSIGAQITMAGYPSAYPDMYEEHMRLRSLNPHCVAITINSGGSEIQVDDAELFPSEPNYGEQLEYIDGDGNVQRATWSYRSGTKAHSSGSFTLGKSTLFSGVTIVTKDFWTNLAAGQVLRLTMPDGGESASTRLKDSQRSAFTRIMPQLLQGTRDTSTMHMPDAFLSLWHPNLGRPYTVFSDDSSRAFYASSGAADTPVDQKPYNNIPEHFETIHYHEFLYNISEGPFSFAMKWMDGKDAVADKTGVAYAGDSLPDGTPQGTTTHNFAGFWPCGSRGGFAASRLDGYAEIVSGYGNGAFSCSSYNYDTSNGIEQKTWSQMNSASDYGRNNCFGYRFGLRQPYNRPRWASAVRGWDEIDSHASDAGVQNDYRHGPVVMQDTGTSTYAGVDTTQSNATIDTNMVGMLERQTSLSALLNHDALQRQVRYAEGRRMTRPFGCPIRTIRNGATATATITVSNTDVANIGDGDTISLISAIDGSTTICYIKGQSDTTTSAATAGHVQAKTLASGSYANPVLHATAQAVEIRTAINHSTKFSATNSANVITVTQSVPGDAGNTTITIAELGATGLSKTNFTGGVTARVHYPGDSVGKGITEVASAMRYYVVDWWGNTRGETVRRFPARGFGVRPAWDPEDAYADNGWADRPDNRSLFFENGFTYPSSMEGENNSVNADTLTRVDWFNPASALRCGDRGDGRGVRWPTVFNESLLMSLDHEFSPTGIVLSTSTAEPSYGQGMLRPSNDVPSNEINRGISRRLGVSDRAGLLEPEATSGTNVETVSGQLAMGADTSLMEPISREAPRIGLDGASKDGYDYAHQVLQTEAHSLHTDRGVGARAHLEGALTVGSHTLDDLDLTSLTWAAQPTNGVLRFSQAYVFPPYGATATLDVESYGSPVSDSGWGAASGTTSNPYQTSAHDSVNEITNKTDKEIRFLLRPFRALDYKHVEMFRPNSVMKSGAPQYGNNSFRATSGGKYGLFTYSTPNARADSSGIYLKSSNPAESNAPYAPVYWPNTSNFALASSKGPSIPGSSMSGFTSTLKGTVARVTMTENTMLQYRSDVHRNGDFSIKPRYSQSLHPKGEDGNAVYDSSEHTSD